MVYSIGATIVTQLQYPFWSNWSLMVEHVLESSFRDPAGFLFSRDGTLFRQVNDSYRVNYDQLMRGGLYESLVQNRQLISHNEVAEAPCSEGAYKVIQPQLIPYVSYPYEWSFSQLKDAGLLTLDIQLRCLDYGFTLKDASAYNVQFIGCKPVFVDTLSFQLYEEGKPWIAYRQFCQHFLGPLAAMAYRDVRIRHLLKSYIDGLPLDLVSSLLPWRSRFRYSLLAHLHLHARSQAKHQDDASSAAPSSMPNVSLAMLRALVGSLRKAVEKLELDSLDTEWGNYYDDTNYSLDAMHFKERAVARLIESHLSAGEIVHDIGANTGRFSQIVADDRATYVLAHDIDELAVERHYRHLRGCAETKILPLLLDATNPTPAIGWRLTERDSFVKRASGGLTMALALVHHLALSNNVPLRSISAFFAGLTPKLIIEFVPKSDSQVRRLLATREDIFPDYDVEGFEKAFAGAFAIVEKIPIQGTDRTLYYMERLVD